MRETLRYTGDIQPEHGETDATGQLLYPYIPNKELIEAVNLSIFLEKPLLLKGEPGCGKTRLARAVARELHLPYEEWLVKSTSEAREGLYTFDTISRLRDAQLEALESKTNKNIERTSENKLNYIELGPLGRAFKNSQKTVVLIDEIDKADIDFPNDLLSELEECRFEIRETGDRIIANKIPIIFITSNDEKDLPDPFLRRCIFHYIEFPDSNKLKQIILSRFPHASKKMMEKAILRFINLRSKMQDDKGEIGKKVTTSELIDWFRVLNEFPEDEVLRLLDGKLPHPSILLKTWEDHQKYLLES
jgi:MoxR-like ATPase